jgi:inositol 1,4,5-triphosphate receptor type 3
MRNFEENIGIYMGRWLTDLIFFGTVILLLLNMINGIIVTTFSALREESEKKLEDIEKRCYICSIDKSEFEKRKISFERHIRSEHNVKDYINFILYLKLTLNKDLDANQGQIKEQINNRDINVFPIFKSKALGEGDYEKEF